MRCAPCAALAAPRAAGVASAPGLTDPTTCLRDTSHPRSSAAQIGHPWPHFLHQQLQRAVVPFRIIRVLRNGQQHPKTPDRLVEPTFRTEALILVNFYR
jgi:hypothetical protein